MQVYTLPPPADLNALAVERRPVRRLSPIPAHFPTVIEEPATPSLEDNQNFPAENNAAAGVNAGGKQRRRLPYISSNMTKNRPSRSFDSGISCLLSSGGSGSPSPPLERDTKAGGGAPHSPACSPVPSRSPVTPSKRASFHALPPRPAGKGPAGSPGSFKQASKSVKLIGVFGISSCSLFENLSFFIKSIFKLNFHSQKLCLYYISEGNGRFFTI